MEQRAELPAQFDKIVTLGELHHERKPPSKHWKFGERLPGTLKGRSKQLFLCLWKPLTPAANNVAERCAKANKCSLHATTFRSNEGVDDCCAGSRCRRL